MLLFFGLYRTFASIGRCTVTGTLGISGFAQDIRPPDPGEIALSFVPGLPFVQRTVRVHTFNSAGRPADNGFRILVSC